MKPGLLMDRMVAEKVMGCHVKKNHKGLFDLVIPGGVNSVDWRVEAGAWSGCPKYSTCITAAWKVFTAISEFQSGYPPIGDMKHPARDDRSTFYKPVIRLEYYEHDGCVEVRIGRCKSVEMDDDVVVSLIGAEDQIPYAICLAALKAVGVQESPSRMHGSG